MHYFIFTQTVVYVCNGLVRSVWMVPAPCYPAPDAGAIIDAIRHAR